MQTAEELAFNLRDGGKDLDPHVRYEIRVEHNEAAVMLTLVELASGRRAHNWSKTLDQDLDPDAELAGLLERAVLQLRDALGRHKLRIASVSALRGPVPQAETTSMLMGAVLREEPVHWARQSWSTSRVNMEVGRVNTVQIRCAPKLADF